MLFFVKKRETEGEKRRNSNKNNKLRVSLGQWDRVRQRPQWRIENGKWRILIRTFNSQFLKGSASADVVDGFAVFFVDDAAFDL